ncbi:MAG: hypothetical protein ACYTHJ_20220 [Planctomycetota bacterium]|jgi:hypothetical protein
MNIKRSYIGVAAVIMLSGSTYHLQADSNLDETRTGQPQLLLRSEQGAITPGQAVTVEVYLRDVQDLAVYQVQVQAAGGDTGTLDLDSIDIDKSREDYVFGDLVVIDAADMRQSRAGAVSLEGAVNVDDTYYLVTYTFKASADASGDFQILVRNSHETFLLNEGAGKIAVEAANAITVAVADQENPADLTRTGRRK